MKCLIYCVFVLFSSVYSEQFENESCKLKTTNSSGVCVFLENCPEAIKDLQKRKYPQICGFQGTKPVICCSNNGTEPEKEKISERKCKEYSLHAFEKVRSPVLIPGGEVVRKECVGEITPLIVGPISPRAKEFPHMALIGFDDESGNKEWLCSGVLISDQHILTSAHCLFSPNFGVPKHVILGITKMSDLEHSQQYNISEAIRHPKYTRRPGSHDIAILKLEKPVKINTYIRPACLHTGSVPEKGLSVGWKAEFNKSPELFRDDVRNFGEKQCEPNNTNDNICLKKEIVRGCNDVIEPVLQSFHSRDLFCMYDIIGIQSWSSSCGYKPAVYTKVSAYVDWIEEVVWPQS